MKSYPPIISEYLNAYIFRIDKVSEILSRIIKENPNHELELDINGNTANVTLLIELIKTYDRLYKNKGLNQIAIKTAIYLPDKKNDKKSGKIYTSKQISKFQDDLPNKIREFIATDDKLLNKAKLLLRITKTNENDDLKFNIGKNTDNADQWIDQCVDLIQYIHNSDMKTRFIYHIKDQNKNVTEEKIEQFIKDILYEFYDFITTEFTGTVDNYIYILSKCEENNLPEIVEVLLLHRALFYMPETNILHPSILKLLDKHEQTMAPENMANMAEAMNYYKQHPKLPEAQSAIELLGKLVFSDH